MKTKRAVLKAMVAVSAVSFAVAGVGTANADTFRLTIAAGHPPVATWVRGMRDFFAPEIAKRVEQRTRHKIEWVHAYGGALCKLGECLEAVESGLADVADVVSTFEPTKLMAHNFSFFVPFGATDPLLAARAALKVYDTVPDLKKILDKYNQVYLATGATGNYGLLTKFPWDKVEQLKGRKIAAAGPNIPWLQGLGVVPVQSTLAEAYTSLQTGVYEAWLMFPSGVVGFKLHELAQNYTFINFGVKANSLITINKDTWKKLPKAVQDIMLEVGREFVEADAKLVVEEEKRGLATMQATAGMNVRALSDAEIVRWANSLPDIPSQRTAEIKKAGPGSESVAAYIKALKEAGVKMPRDWAVK